ERPSENANRSPRRTRQTGLYFFSRWRKEFGAMTAPAAQWQLDRLSTSARAAAESAAVDAGASLSSWITRLITETSSAEGVAPPAEPAKILEFTREPRDRMPP